MAIRFIRHQILDGNLLNDRDPTRDQVDDLVARIETALRAACPEAEIVIDLQRNTCGACANDLIECDEDDNRALAELEVHEICERCWMEWCEALPDLPATMTREEAKRAGDVCDHDDGYTYDPHADQQWTRWAPPNGRHEPCREDETPETGWELRRE